LQTGWSLIGSIGVIGSLTFNQSISATLSNAITGTGSVIQDGTGSLTLTGANTYSGGTTISGLGNTVVVNNSIPGTSSSIGIGTLTFDGGTLQVKTGAAPLSFSNGVAINSTGATFDANGQHLTWTGAIVNGTGSPTGSLTILDSSGTGVVTLAPTTPGANTYSGATIIGDASHSVTLQGGTALAFSANSAVTVNALGALDLGGFNQNIAALSGAGMVTNSGTSSPATLTISGGTATTFSGIIQDGSSTTGLTLSGNGTLLTLSGANTYTGATNVNAGTLNVTGSIASSSLTTVANGAMLTGTGTVGSLQINPGGMFAPGAGTPGGSMTIAGNLAFQSGAVYLVQVTPSAAVSTNVSGTATLTGGTVNAQFASGSYVARQYTIVTATGGFGGTSFAGLTNSNLPVGFADRLSYGSNNVFLNLTATLGAGQALNANQHSVAGGLNNFFNSGGTLPPGFANVFGLTGANLGNALAQLSGETATGAEHGAFQLMNGFLNLMFDTYGDGHAGVGSGGQAFGFAPDQVDNLPPDIALAYAAVLKAPPKQTLEQRWAAWGSAFGGSGIANGDPGTGSNNVTTGTFGYGAGIDYHLAPDTVFGFALGGGGTGWNLAQGLGSGSSDAFLAGIHGVTHQGPVYFAGSLAFANNWFTTSRTALGDQFTATFQGQSYVARLEGGYRVTVPLDRGFVGITPYAAIQAQNFRTPDYSESSPTGAGFGLSYNATTNTDTRSELGARFDDPTLVGNTPLVLHARLAWAHDWVSNPALNAAFEALPGAGFTVNGAPIPHDTARTSAGAELFLASNWSLVAKFDGEFASRAQTYAGTGALRHTW
jgi:autotransporter-associated beta strand protein